MVSAPDQSERFQSRETVIKGWVKVIHAIRGLEDDKGQFGGLDFRPIGHIVVVG